jgi:hypothetical protein
MYPYVRTPVDVCLLDLRLCAALAHMPFMLIGMMCVRVCIHTYIHTCIHTYIHTHGPYGHETYVEMHTNRMHTLSYTHEQAILSKDLLESTCGIIHCTRSRHSIRLCRSDEISEYIHLAPKQIDRKEPRRSLHGCMHSSEALAKTMASYMRSDTVVDAYFAD